MIRDKKISVTTCPKCDYCKYTGDSYTLIKEISETGRCPGCGYDYVEEWRKLSKSEPIPGFHEAYKKRVESFEYARSLGVERIEGLILCDGISVMIEPYPLSRIKKRIMELKKK